jgi:hypothetical protein
MKEILESQRYILKALNKKQVVGFEVLTAVTTKKKIYWDVMPCSLVDVYLHLAACIAYL